VKREVKEWIAQFESQFGRQPSKTEKSVIDKKFLAYKLVSVVINYFYLLVRCCSNCCLTLTLTLSMSRSAQMSKNVESVQKEVRVWESKLANCR
jgi:hypothetical protein